MLVRFIIYIVLVIVVITLTMAIIKNSKLAQKQIDNISDKVKEQITEENDKKSPHKCEYCGGQIPAGIDKCPNCGAKRK